MLKIQELQFDGEVLRIREPRLKDFVRARAAEKSDDYVFLLLEGMLIDADGKELGADFVQNLPMRMIDPLTRVVNDMTRGDEAPLAPSGGSSTDSPLPLAE